MRSKLISRFCVERAQEAENPENSAPLAASRCHPAGTWQDRRPRGCPWLCPDILPCSCPAPLLLSIPWMQPAAMDGRLGTRQCHHCPFLPAASACVPATAPFLGHGDSQPSQELSPGPCPQPEQHPPLSCFPSTTPLAEVLGSTWSRTGQAALRAALPGQLGWPVPLGEPLLWPRCQRAKNIPRVMEGMIPSFSDRPLPGSTDTSTEEQSPPEWFWRWGR